MPEEWGVPKISLELALSLGMATSLPPTLHLITLTSIGINLNPRHHPLPNTQNIIKEGRSLANKNGPMAIRMLPYHQMLGDKKTSLAFFIVPTNDIEFICGHGSIKKIYTKILFIYLVKVVW